jgi:hypothetical protein
VISTGWKEWSSLVDVDIFFRKTLDAIAPTETGFFVGFCRLFRCLVRVENSSGNIQLLSFSTAVKDLKRLFNGTYGT